MTKPGQEVSAHVVDDITETTSVSISTTYQNIIGRMVRLGKQMEQNLI